MPLLNCLHANVRGVKTVAIRLSVAFALVLLLAPGPAGAVTPEPPDIPEAPPRVDRILIDKSARRMDLLADGQVVRTYQIALGRNPVGHKLREGDGRTPEGIYRIDWRNPNSAFHLSLHIDYPNPIDRARAASASINPGSLIMIHGLPNGRSARDVGHPVRDWTDGCIAVTNAEIQEIWRLVPDGTVVIIEP